MIRSVVSLNSGSSSIKFALYDLDGEQPALAVKGKIERIGNAPRLIAHHADGTLFAMREWPGWTTHAALLKALFDWGQTRLGDRRVVGVGHRVVHGGTEFSKPVVVDAVAIEALDALSPLAPLHQPHNLSAIRTIADLWPGLPQVACFDTAFHHGLPDVATRFALPRSFHDRGVRRYGFHGISYEYVAHRLNEIDPDLAGGRVIVAHLGSGASLCAMDGGRSVDTTMGFTALDGLVMGTRCGTLDPGVVLHLQAVMGMSVRDVEELLYRRSGLLGLSGVSNDMRALSINGSPEARGAIEAFVWRAGREAGGLISSLGGLDGLVFTAGIGENDPAIRARICDRLRWTGLMLDAGANAAGSDIVSAAHSPVAVRVIPTDEEWMIARHTATLLEGEG